MKVRPYQQEIIQSTVDYIQGLGHGCGIMVQSPTGSGKTVVGIKLIEMFMKAQPNHAHAWLTHRRELRKQSGSSLIGQGISVYHMSVVPPDRRFWSTKRVNIISPAMKRWPAFTKKSPPGLLIVDEAHHTPAASWARFVKEWQTLGGIVVGLTATPWRMSKNQSFLPWYGALVKGPSIKELQENDYLATPRVVHPPNAHIDESDARMMSTGDYAFDWMEESVKRLLDQEVVAEHWIATVADRKDKRTMWFLPTVYSAYMLKGILEHATGLPAEVLDGDTPADQRDRILAALKYKRLTHLISVDVLGEGIDIPSVPIVASLRTTKSLVVWLQQCGRASRPKKKDKAGFYTVLDYAGNSQRHGTPDAPREWFLDARSKHSKGMQDPPVANCFNAACREGGVQLHPAERFCWNCNFPQYGPCERCHVHQRWTQIGKDKVCNGCIAAAKQLEAESKATRRESAVSSVEHLFKKQVLGHLAIPARSNRSYAARTAKLHSKITPRKRRPKASSKNKTSRK